MHTSLYTCTNKQSSSDAPEMQDLHVSCDKDEQDLVQFQCT